MLSDREKALVVVKLVEAIVESVEEVHPDPAPESAIYLALQTHGIGYESYQKLIELAVKAGKLKRGGNHCLVVA